MRSELALVLLMAGIWSCSDDAGVPASDGDLPGTGGRSSTGGAPGSGGNLGTGGTGTGTGTGGLPPEQETETAYQVPATTGRFIWSANPQSGRVALIDAQTRRIRSVNAGLAPTFMSAVPSSAGHDAAIVLNVADRTATLFDVDVAGQISTRTFATHAGANAWQIEATGRYAIAWSDYRKVTKPDPADGYQEITVIDLVVGNSARLSVGFRPTAVVFDAEQKRAFAVVSEGISVIELSGTPRQEALIELDPLPAGAPPRDVSFDRAGHLALVRGASSPELLRINLETGQEKRVNLGDIVTDVDLSADGQSAYAVLGDKSKLIAVSIPELELLQSAQFPDEIVRSVQPSSDGAALLLYSTGVPSSHLTIAKPEAQGFAARTLDLKGVLNAVFVAPHNKTAVVFAKAPEGSQKAGILALVPLDRELPPKLISLDAPALDIAFGDATEDKALVVVRDEVKRAYGVYRIGLSNLEDDFLPLASLPLKSAVGLVQAARRGFIAQNHPEGRISLIGLDSGEVQTLTGFELGSTENTGFIVNQNPIGNLQR